MGTGIQPKKLDIQHVRKPGNRMPITGRCRGERPAKAFPADAVFNLVVFINIPRGVIIIKIKCPDPGIGRKSNQDQKKTDPGLRTDLTGSCICHLISEMEESLSDRYQFWLTMDRSLSVFKAVRVLLRLFCASTKSGAILTASLKNAIALFISPNFIRAAPALL